MKSLKKLKIFILFLLIALFAAGTFWFWRNPEFFSQKNLSQSLKTQITGQETAGQTTQAEHNKYESVYQIPLEIPYCSLDSNGGELGKYPCDATHYLHWKTYTGFKQQWNPNESILRCRQNTPCPANNSDLIYYGLDLYSGGKSITGDLFRYYLPKGTQFATLNLYGPPTAGDCATLARFGSPPTSEFPTSFDQFSNMSAYPDIFPPEQYTEKRVLWNGKTIEQLKQNDWFAVNQGGHLTVVNSNSATKLETGGWLYIKVKRYDASQILKHIYTWSADEATYTSWYNSFTSYDSKGDPAFGQNAATLPGDIEPQTSPDGDVDIFDYNVFIQYWSQSPSNNPADIDQNGTVDIFDYNLLVGNFGKKN